MKLIAVREVYYASKTRYPGDEFECDSDSDARILTAPDLVGGQKAKYADEPEQKKPAPVQTAAVRAEPVPAKEAEPEADKQRKVYKRRDVRAED